MKFEPGDVVWIAFGSRVPPGHEQQGERPALIVAAPHRLGRMRFPLLLVAPVTSYNCQAWVDAAPRLYPLVPGSALSRPSVVLLDQVQSVDARRVLRAIARLDRDEYAPVRASLEQML